MGTPSPAGFVVKPVANRTVSGLVGANTLGMVLHVQAGNNALSGWFNNPAAQASSTWWAGKVGGREQYGNPDTDKFWAQSAGNSRYHSVETEGYPNEPLTAAQIESCAVAYAWGHDRYGWPFQLAEKPGDRGLGWHGMGGSAWGGHTGCPGDTRKAQRKQILERAKQIAGATQLAPAQEAGLAADDVQKVNDYTFDILFDGFTKDGKSYPGVYKVLVENQRRITALSKLIQPDDLTAAVKAALPANAGQVDVDALAKKIVLELGKETA